MSKRTPANREFRKRLYGTVQKLEAGRREIKQLASEARGKRFERIALPENKQR